MTPDIVLANLARPLNHMAMDANGAWWGFENKPYLVSGTGDQWQANGGDVVEIKWVCIEYNLCHTNSLHSRYAEPEPRVPKPGEIWRSAAGNMLLIIHGDRDTEADETRCLNVETHRVCNIHTPNMGSFVSNFEYGAGQ